MLRQNAWFFTAFSLFIIIVAYFVLHNEHGDVIHFFSDRRTPFGNFFFFYFTKMGEEFVYIVVLILLLFVRYKYAVIVPLLGLTVAIVSFSSKAFFAQPRPGLYFETLQILDHINLIDGVRLNNGHTSFPSGHTMSAFALYTFLALCWPKKKWTGLVIFTIALLVGFSRIYLVQHFLCDIYLGAIMGVFIAMLWYMLTEPTTKKMGEWGNRKLTWSEGRLNFINKSDDSERP